MRRVIEYIDKSKTKELNYLTTFLSNELFIYYRKLNNISDKELARKLKVSMTTITKFKSEALNSTWKPKICYLQAICRIFCLSVDEAEVFCNNYSYSFIISHYPDDIALKEELKKNPFRADVNPNISASRRREIIKKLVKYEADYRTSELAELLNTSNETIIRDFKKMKIKNHGTEWFPVWEIEE